MDRYAHDSGTQNATGPRKFFVLKNSVQLWSPTGTPPEVIRKINADAIAVVKRVDFQERLLKDGVEGVGNTPEQFAAQIRADLASWARVVKASGAKME